MLTNCFFLQNSDAKDTVVNGPLIAVPFESKTDDDKFLEEASKLTNLIKSSALDLCQHKVVLSIKTSCADMTEEELAKMSVHLLNCQSAVDGRQTFPCAGSMVSQVRFYLQCCLYSSLNKKYIKMNWVSELEGMHH